MGLSADCQMGAASVAEEETVWHWLFVGGQYLNECV